MVETDEFMSSSAEGFDMDSITISTAYLKMKNLCMNIGNEIQADIKIHDQHILPRYWKKFISKGPFVEMNRNYFNEQRKKLKHSKDSSMSVGHCHVYCQLILVRCI